VKEGEGVTGKIEDVREADFRLISVRDFQLYCRSACALAFWLSANDGWTLSWARTIADHTATSATVARNGVTVRVQRIGFPPVI
jgi:hypothetical protein